jgi:hypothetical protein
LAERLDVAFRAVRVGLRSRPALLQIALGESATLAQANSLVDTSGNTILHVIAVTLAKRTRISMYHPETHTVPEREAQEHERVDGKDFTETLENEMLTSWQIGGST